MPARPCECWASCTLARGRVHEHAGPGGSHDRALTDVVLADEVGVVQHLDCHATRLPSCRKRRQCRERRRAQIDVHALQHSRAAGMSFRNMKQGNSRPAMPGVLRFSSRPCKGMKPRTLAKLWGGLRGLIASCGPGSPPCGKLTSICNKLAE